MSKENLVSYLKDHLAGAAAGLEISDDLIAIYSDQPERAFFVTLRDDIESDESTLKAILHKAGSEPGGVRKAGAWISEKAAKIKLKMAGTEEGGLGRYEAMEGLTIGIAGKMALWQALAASGLDEDFEMLQRRAEDQLARLKPYRLEAARLALSNN
jgi:hypothetical protein